MSEILTNNKYYSDIADTIRQMKGVATTYKPREMAGALRDMYSTEVEGAPPLTFPSNGNNLLNYRIDGANGGVGDRTANLFDYNWLFDYEQKKVNEYFNYIQITLEPNTTYNVTSDYNYNQAQNATAFIVVNSNTAITTANGGVFGSLTVTTTQDGILKIARRTKGNNEAMIPKREDFENNSKHIQISINPVNDDNYEPYGKYKIPIIINGKNIFDENSELNAKGTMDLASGLFPISTGANRRSFFFKAKPNTTYTFSCATIGDRFVVNEYNRIINPSDYSTSNKLTPTNKIYSQTSGIREYTFTTSSTTKMVGIYYALNTIPTNIQIEVGNAKTTYEAYTEQITNIYLDEPIEENESKSLSDTNVNISTINGTNILSVNTTVQPSKVYVQAPKTNGDYNIKVDTSNNISDNWYGLNAYIVEIGNIDTSNIIDMSGIFAGCQMITEIPLLNTQNVTNMGNMFYDCLALTTVPLLNTQNVTDMGGMFSDCSALTTVPLLNTQNVTNMSGMFLDCSALTTVPLLNTQNVTNMSSMFLDCQALTNETLNNVLKMCINAVKITSNKTLSYIGLSQAQATTCTTLSNYQDFLNAGWTTGY